MEVTSCRHSNTPPHLPQRIRQPNHLIKAARKAPPGNDSAPGDVSTQQMNDAINNALAGTPSNCNTVTTLSCLPSDPPTDADWQVLADKLNELINALIR